MSCTVGNIGATNSAAANTFHAAATQGQGTRPRISILKLQRPLSSPDEGPSRFPWLSRSTHV